MAGQRYEIWSGGEATRQAFSLFTGTVWAPFGSIRDDGWRLRASGGRGYYSYGTGDARVDGVATFSDLLAGYRASLGAVTVKGYAGIAADVHLTDPFDPGNALDGGAIGVKLVLETWANLSPEIWTAVDAAWTMAHATYSTRARLGWRVAPLLSLGVEAGTFGNVESDGGRRGGFARLEWEDGEVSVTGGYTGNLRAPDTPFGALNLTMRF